MTNASTKLMMIVSRLKLDTLPNDLWLPQLIDRVSSDEMLADVNTALRTIPTIGITETSELIYTTATVILEALG